MLVVPGIASTPYPYSLQCETRSDQERFDIRRAVRYCVRMFSDLTFESRNVVGLVGVSERELRHWADRGILTPDIADAVGRPGVRRRYSFENLVQAAIVKELLRQGINLHDAGKMLIEYKHSMVKHSPGRLYLIVQNGTASVLDMMGQPAKGLGARLEKLLDPQMARDSFSVIAIHQLRERLIARVKETARR